MTKMKMIFWSTAFLFALGLLPNALAQERRDPAQMFSRIDRNGDGVVTKDEIPSERRDRFARMLEMFDKNNDQRLSKQEFGTLPAGRRGPANRGPGGDNADARFEQSAPKVGERLPDATGFDAGGRPFKLSSLKGSYSVLVFGCLT